MASQNINLLELLRPRQANRIIDLVEQAGIDVSKWSINENGQMVKTSPAANPKYCYEWTFGGNQEPILFCIWHKSLKCSNGQVSFEDNLRQLSLELVRKAENKDQKVRSRASSQAKRARNFDKALIACFQKPQPIRVAILEGDPRSREELGFDSSSVKYRTLDSEPWYLHEYQMETGSFRIVRAVPLQVNSPALITESQTGKFADQFSISDSPEKRESTGFVYVRSPEVRESVLKRASGVCELCGESGFKTAGGIIYLETHHVIPLAENGPDKEWNVVAICPTDHRRAHYSADRDEIRTQLLDLLAKRYPNQPICNAELSVMATSNG
jgi:5-methylcytosine-specific restriction protein A